MRIAIQGEAASFHHTAAIQWFGDTATIIPCNTFADVFRTVDEHRADAAVVAIENSLYGSINQVYDLLESHHHPIIGEVHLPVRQQLIGTSRVDITHIYSHPVALAQCERFLDTHYPNAERIEHADTAGAVHFISQQHNPHYAAIASAAAAALYDVPIIQSNIEDNPANITRFLIIDPQGTPPTDANRTSLVLTTTHTPGALAAVLSRFAEAGVNLSKLQSRPIHGKPWHYSFYLVVDTAGETLHAALKDIEPHITSLKILGEYHHDTSTQPLSADAHRVSQLIP